MTSVGYATLDVIPSVKNLRSNLEKQTSSDLTAAGKLGGAKFGQAAGVEAGSGFKSKFSGALKGFAPLAGLLGGAGAVAFLKGAISGASDLSESTSKVNVVFGEAAKSVTDFGAAASKSMGQSNAQALDAAGTFGNLLRSVGLSEQEAAKFSTTMVSLGSDLASFNNTSVDDALEALRSGLVGETEPLKRFGVNLNDATLKAQALKMGLGDGKSVLTASAKAQAAYTLIMKQTSLAQGDFARTSSGLANEQRTLSARWADLTATLGQDLLPVATKFVSFLASEAIPAMSSAGDVASSFADAMGKIPAPLYAGAAAFAALRLAAAAGIGTAAAAGFASVASSAETLRIRLMLAAGAYRSLRGASIVAVGAGFRFSSGLGRIRAGLGAVRAGAIGAAGAMRASFSSALGVIGGPWGAAFIGATIILTKFWTQQQKTKSQVEELTQTLNKQTGAITKNTEKTVAKNLLDSGALDAAKTLGLSLEDVTQAALGNKDAITRLSAAWAAIPDQAPGGGSDGLTTAEYEAMQKLQDAISGQGEVVAKSKDNWVLFNDALGKSKGAQDRLTPSTRKYADVLGEANNALKSLLKNEEKRRLNAIQAKRDQIALIETTKATEKEARKGKQTLDLQTNAGRANFKALLDLADQWNASRPKVQNAQGAYAHMRTEFIRLADQMGATRDEAVKLADKYLKIPKTAELKFQSKGFRERMAEIAALKAALAGIKRGAGTTMDFSPRGFGSTGANALPSRAPGSVNFNGPINVTADDPNRLVKEIHRKTRSRALGGI